MTARRLEASRWAALLGVVAVAVAWRGGYGAGARAVFAALTGLAALGATATAPEAAARAARHPVVAALAALSAITALSALWTTGSPGDAAREAVTVLALAALIVVAATLKAPNGHAAVLLAAAVGTALLGLGATLARADPLALSICGSWRPAGPFEYPPALALVCAGALPPALRFATERRRVTAAAGVLAAWLLATCAALTANRSGVALCGLALTAAVALAPRGRTVGPAAIAVLLAALASTLLVGGDLAASSSGERALALLPAAALAFASLSGRRPWRVAVTRARWTVIVGGAAILATTALVLADRGGPCGGDPSHGRAGIWRAAIATARERPLQGFGAGTFLEASRSRQLKERAVPTRFAHDLPLQEWVELGIAGLLAVLVWYAAVARTAVLALRRPRPPNAAWLLGPAMLAFPLANLLDWPWELTGTGALWAVALGGLIGTRERAG